jgi:two-component system alkaline phosphatase synthesis response regulator PhoP
MNEKKRILVVDDEPDFCSIVQGQLEKEGFEVELAYNGVEGLEKTRTNPPDAIVLDVMMPEMDGYEMCKELKDDENCCDIPVILLTAVASHVTSTRYSHADGASAEEIVRSIKRLLSV